jgi:hypothetical protein
MECTSVNTLPELWSKKTSGSFWERFPEVTVTNFDCKPDRHGCRDSENDSSVGLMFMKRTPGRGHRQWVGSSCLLWPCDCLQGLVLTWLTDSAKTDTASRRSSPVPVTCFFESSQCDRTPDWYRCRLCYTHQHSARTTLAVPNRMEPNHPDEPHPGTYHALSSPYATNSPIWSFYAVFASYVLSADASVPSSGSTWKLAVMLGIAPPSRCSYAVMEGCGYGVYPLAEWMALFVWERRRCCDERWLVC